MPTESGMLASVDLGPTLLYFAVSGDSVGARPEYTTWKNGDPAAGVDVYGSNISGATYQDVSVTVVGVMPGVRIEFTSGSSEFEFPVTFLPNSGYLYIPNGGELLPGAAVVVEASADLIRTKVNGGAWVNSDITGLKESWVSEWERDNFWRRIRIFSEPIPPIVLDPALYVGDVGPAVPVPAWSTNNVRVYVLGSEPPPGFWTNFVLSSEAP